MARNKCEVMVKNNLWNADQLLQKFEKPLKSSEDLTHDVRPESYTSYRNV